MAFELVRALPYNHPYRWNGSSTGGLNLWRPFELGSNLALWLDAEDTNTITLNGSTVSQWNDKSGNGRNVAQATAGSQPTYSIFSASAKAALSFDGGDWLENLAPGTLLRAAPGATLATVANYTNNAAGRCAVGISTPTAGQNRATLSANLAGTAGYLTGGRRLDSDTFGLAGSATFTAAATLIQTGVLDYANSDAFSYVNGSLNASNTSFQTNGNTSDTNPGALYVGISGTGTNFMLGLVGEVIVTSTALDAANRERVEGYLAWKWALEGNLPAGHTYKNIPPTV
jgi:hypothetical protein